LSNANNDAFGVTNDNHDHDHHDFREDGHFGDDHPKPGTGGAKGGGFSFAALPMVGKVGIGAVAFLFLVIFGTVLSNMLGRSRPQAPAASETVFQQIVKNEISGIKQSIASVQEAQLDLNRKLEQFAVNQPREIEVVTQRVVGVERSMNTLNESLKTLARRAATERSFDFDMMAREDARIVSIGNGVARIVLLNGKEMTLQKGDKFNGLLVRELLSDRRVVVLSDGSVIL